MACLAPSPVYSWAAVLVSVYIGGVSLRMLYVCFEFCQKPNLEMFFKTCSFYVGHCFGRGERAWGNLRLHSFPWQRLNFLASVTGLGNRGGCAGVGLGISNPVKNRGRSLVCWSSNHICCSNAVNCTSTFTLKFEHLSLARRLFDAARKINMKNISLLWKKFLCTFTWLHRLSLQACFSWL